MKLKDKIKVKIKIKIDEKMKVRMKRKVKIKLQIDPKIEKIYIIYNYYTEILIYEILIYFVY